MANKTTMGSTATISKILIKCNNLHIAVILVEESPEERECRKYRK